MMEFKLLFPLAKLSVKNIDLVETLKKAITERDEARDLSLGEFKQGADFLAIFLTRFREMGYVSLRNGNTWTMPEERTYRIIDKYKMIKFLGFNL